MNFIFVKSTSEDWVNSELIILYLESDVLIFVLEDYYLRTLFETRY